MRAILEGWSHREKTHVVAQGVLTRAGLRKQAGAISQQEVEIVPFDHLDFSEKRSDGRVVTNNIELWGDQSVTGGVCIRSGTSLTINGDFEFTLKLSSDEILLPATEVMKAWPLEYVMKKIAALRSTVESETE